MDDGVRRSAHGDRAGVTSTDSVNTRDRKLRAKELLAQELYEAGGGADSLRDKYRKQAEVATRLLSEAAAPRECQVTERSRTGEKLVILVRHARRIRDTAKEERYQRMEGWPEGQHPSPQAEEDDGTRTRKSGWKKTLDIAISLAEQFDVTGVQVSHILYSKHTVAKQTAKVYAAVLCRRAPVALGPLPWLTPENFRQYRRKEITREVHQLWAQSPSGDTVGTGGQAKGQAIILVGHQPQLTEIADAVLRKSWWRRLTVRALPIPLGSSEAACLRLGRSPQLRWLLTEKGTALATELKDKIKSKVDIAKFFLGALAVNASLLVNTNLWSTAGPDQWLVLGFGALMIFTGLLFAIATLSGYDALNMPSEFWAEAARLDAWQRRAWGTERSGRESILRPPSEATVLLFYEMVNVWRRFFLPSLICSMAGVSCFLLTLVMARLDVLLATPPAARPPAFLTRVIARLDTLLPAVPPDIWIVAAGILVLLGLFLAVRQRFFLPALLICSTAGVLYVLFARVTDRFNALPAPSPGTGASVAVSPSTPPLPAAMQPDIWIIAFIVFVLLGLFVRAYYRTRGPKLGLED
jgi:phosphohistidine phosphatase SixA